MTRAEQQKILRIAVLAAKQAARIHMESYEKPHHIKSKRSLADVVTEVDVRSQKQIIKTIKRHFPSHDILAEEKGAPRSKSRVLWIVDPLDGTLNYSHGYPGFAVSIGVEVEGRLEVGVILHPPSGETFTVTRGGGAYLGRRRLQCSNISRLNLSLVTTGFSPKPDEAKRNIGFFVRAIGRVQAIRRGGSAALDLAYVAAGRLEAYWDLTLNPWDMAAGALLVTEAGGHVSQPFTSTFSVHTPGILASNGKTHGALQRLLRPL